MTLTRADIAEVVQRELGIPKSQSADLIELLLETIKTTLSSGDDVLISGFGKFTVKEKSARRGRNPSTGEDLMLSPRRIVTFKCSAKMRNRINGRG